MKVRIVLLAALILVLGLPFNLGSLGQSEAVVEDFETGDFSKFYWQTGGNADWSISELSHGGSYAARAGEIDDNGISWLEVKVVIAEGEMGFWYKVSSEVFDPLRFYIDGQEKNKLSGQTDWQQVTHEVTAAGIHTFRWEYTKDSSGSEGQDTAWIDDISFPPRLPYLLVESGQSIQETIDAAPERTVIQVEPGTYRENLIIEKSLILKGAGWEETVIERKEQGKPVIMVKADQPIEVTIEGFMITEANEKIGCPVVAP